MTRKIDDDRMFMEFARLCGQRSHAVRLKVGCVIVKDERVISLGWNGTPHGADNCCEYKVTVRGEDGTEHEELRTRSDVLHAELNAIAKLAGSSESAHNATLYVTHSPCEHCALLIYRAGISEVVYETLYRSDEGIRFLQRFGVTVRCLEPAPAH